MHTEQQIDFLKEELINRKQELENRFNQEQNSSNENYPESIGELSSYDNHPADMGTELYDWERNLTVSDHAERESDQIETALHAIEKGSYGTCKTCGKTIPFERLQAIPYTLYCVEHTSNQLLENHQPVIEEERDNVYEQHLENIRNERNDHNDSFQEVARFGTSETPSDLQGQQELYKLNKEEGFTEEYERFLGNDIDDKNTKMYTSNNKQGIKNY